MFFSKPNEKDDADDILDAIARFLLKMEARHHRAKNDPRFDLLPGIYRETASHLAPYLIPTDSGEGATVLRKSADGRYFDFGPAKYSDEELRLAMELERVE